MAFKNIAVIGGGGNLSPSIINALLSSPHGYSVTIVSRESSSYQQPPAGAKLVKTDYSHDSLVAAFKGQDAVVSTIAGNAIGDQTKIIDAAIAAGVKRFFPSEFGSDTDNTHALEYFPGWASKGEIRKYLESKQDQIEWTAIFNGFFFDWGLKVGFIPFNASKKEATIYGKYKDVRFSVSTLNTVGQAVAQSLSPSVAPKTANQILRVRSLTTSLSEILATFEDVTGAKWTVHEADLDAEVKEAQAKLQKGDFSGVGNLIFGAALDTRTEMDFDAGGRASNAVLELPTLELKPTIKSVL